MVWMFVRVNGMSLITYLAALASWIFFFVMGYLSHRRCEGGWTIFLVGSVIFCCIGVFLLGASLWKRQGKPALFGFVVLLPHLLDGLVFCHEGAAEIGAREEPLSFMVIDAGNQKPIPNALVRILTEVDKERFELVRGQSEGRTQTDGSVTLRPELTFTHRHIAFQPSGAIRFWDKRLEISADGYEPLSGELQKYTGLGKYLYDPPLPPLTIEMKRPKFRE
jgi:hypothetical protein